MDMMICDINNHVFCTILINLRFLVNGKSTRFHPEFVDEFKSEMEQLTSKFHQNAFHFGSMKFRLNYDVDLVLRKRFNGNSTRIRRRFRVDDSRSVFNTALLTSIYGENFIRQFLTFYRQFRFDFDINFQLGKKLDLNLTRIRRRFWVVNWSIDDAFSKMGFGRQFLIGKKIGPEFD